MKVGIAILATDRIHCTMRLIESMIKYDGGVSHDICVFDDSSKSSDELERYIETLAFQPKQQRFNSVDYIKTGSRIGIAKNTNEALKHLKDYDYKFIFNQDMIVKSDGWVSHYIDASQKTGIQHFCFNQKKLWGAQTSKRPFRNQNINGVDIITIDKNPHGCLLFLTNAVFDIVGYFDSKLFNSYGYSHHLWSHSVSHSNIQISGIHDTVDSNKYFRVFDEQCTTPNKERMESYKKNRVIFERELNKLKSGERSVYTDAE